MGGKESKPISLTYEEALKRVNEAELTRIKDAYKRTGTLNGALTKQAFVREVLGDAVSCQLAELIFYACGGSPKGIAFKDLFCSLVLLTRGTRDEKIRFIFGVYANEAGTHVVRSEMLSQLKATEDGFIPESVHKLFSRNEKSSFEEFREWLLSNPDGTTITRWLLDEHSAVSLSNDLETPTFYQTLAGVTHLEESEILELEKRYWTLKGLSPSGKLDPDTLVPMMYPLPPLLAKGVFNAFDENRDNHIDFKEMACGISAACRGPQTERQKFCFKIFDMDRDGKLNENELFLMCQSLLQLQADENEPPNSDDVCTGIPSGEVEKVVKEILKNHDHDPTVEGFVTQEEFLIWTLTDSLTSTFLDIIFQVCHIILGLKPSSPNEEGDIVLGWLRRSERKSLTVGQFWYIISMDWWNTWLSYVAFSKDALHSSFGSQNNVQNISNKKTRFQRANIEGCLAMDNSGVTVTSISTLSIGDSSLTPLNANGGSEAESLKGTLQKNASSTSLHRRNASSSSHNLTVSSYDSRGSSPSHSPCLSRRPNGPGLSSGYSRPSAIDNSPLLETPTSKIPQLTSEGGRLKRNVPLVQGRDFVLVPDSLWKVLLQWYGGAPALPRQVIHGRASGEVELEFYPVTLKILRHVQPQNRSNLGYATNNWVGLGGYGAAISKIADSTQYYVANLPPLSSAFPKRTLAYLAAFSRLATLKQVYEFLGSKLRLRTEDFRLWHVREEPAGMSLLEEESLTLEEAGLVDLSQVLLEVRNKDLTWPEEMSQLSRSSSPYLIKSMNKQGAGEKGVTGLNNLGNTCFLNAAIQCCSNTVPLTTYFTRNMHLYELNPNNPCGMKGHMARQYGALMQEIWNGGSKTVAPLKLRWTIGKYSGNFTTFQQQDSQELLAFLLDGLHEDLNRVHNKPYMELKDSEGRPDTLVAQEAWENHILRNKSIIVDLFHGQLKSKVTCNVCGNESVRFDPFSYLTLQLPMESYVYMEVVVLKLDGRTPVKYGLRLISDAKYKDVKWHLSALTGIGQQQFMLADLSNAQVKTILGDDLRIRPSNSPIYAYELPLSPQVDQAVAGKNVSRSAKDRELFSRIQRSTHMSSPCLSMGLSKEDKKGAAHPETSDQDHYSLEASILASIQNSESEKDTDSVDSSLGCLSPTGSLPNPSVPTTSSSAPNSLIRDDRDLEKVSKGFIIGFHRKMIRQEVYFLSSQKSRPSLFGLPLIVPCDPSYTTHQDLYRTVWTQVSRLVSPLPPSESPGPNHAQDCDDSLGYEFPFVLRMVERNGLYCAQCPWYHFCRGCEVPCDLKPFGGGVSFLAVDWDPTALHLRYQSSLERVFQEHGSVAEMQRRHTDPISLSDCLEAFCSEETLEYSCEKCGKMQQAAKKLQIWRLPPILIVHLKRFQFVGNKWVKSQKIVDFPLRNFDPTDYLASVPRQTILLHEAELEGVDPATYVAGLHEKDNVFLEIVPENKVMEDVMKTSDPSYVNEKLPNGRSAKLSSYSSENNSVVDKRRRMRNGSVLYGDALQDFHQHRLDEGFDPLDLKYNLYAIACHTGIMEGGHYVCYAKNPQGKWICFNDSSCKEVSESELDLQSAYLLFYERVGMSVERYMPNVSGKTPFPADEEEDSEELRRQCSVM